jgi:hypothetical protein
VRELFCQWQQAPVVCSDGALQEYESERCGHDFDYFIDSEHDEAVFNKHCAVAEIKPPFVSELAGERLVWI